MPTTLMTTKGKARALEALEERRRENEEKEKINNCLSPPGWRMYYYCKSCGGLSDELPEKHVSLPKPLCDECQALKDLGWLE